MFTGIIHGLGKVNEIKRLGSVYRLSIITAEDISRDTHIGDSISVNGVCLTVVEATQNRLIFDIMDETLKKTNLARLRIGDFTNMEQSLKLGDKISGHLVSGHIDGTARIKRITISGQTACIEIELPYEFKRFIVSKGSVAVDGVSLTVGDIGPNWFMVYIIPHTLNYTRFRFVKSGDLVNIELDLVAKYAQNKNVKYEIITESFLKEKGFI